MKNLCFPLRTRQSSGNAFDDLYDRAVAELLDIAVTEDWVDTRVGKTHVLTAGDPTDPPVIVFQGGNVTNPITLAWFQSLAEDYYLIAPDTVGEPGMSVAEAPKEYGPWVVDVLDEIGIERVAMVGASHGAGVLLETAIHAPERISAAALVVPAGFGTPLSLGLARIVVPSLLYRAVPSRWLLERALQPMFTQSVATIDEITLKTVGTALRTSDLTADFPGPDGVDVLRELRVPILLVTAERDPFFPGMELCNRASRLLPPVTECVVLTDERHFLSPDGQSRAARRTQEFLKNRADGD